MVIRVKCSFQVNIVITSWNLLLKRISKNLLVVYRESVNLIGYITRRLSAVSKIQQLDIFGGKRGLMSSFNLRKIF